MDRARALRAARELVEELEAEHGDAADLARVLLLALERPEVLRSPRSGKPRMLLRRVERALDRYERGE
jgi:hypothetical protein